MHSKKQAKSLIFLFDEPYLIVIEKTLLWRNNLCCLFLILHSGQSMLKM